MFCIHSVCVCVSMSQVINSEENFLLEEKRNKKQFQKYLIFFYREYEVKAEY